VEDDDGEDDGAMSQFEGNRDDAMAGHLGSTTTARVVQMAEAVRKGGGFGGGTGGSGEGGGRNPKDAEDSFFMTGFEASDVGCGDGEDDGTRWGAEMGRTTAAVGGAGVARECVPTVLMVKFRQPCH
jgi:hypothetical protein